MIMIPVSVSEDEHLAAHNKVKIMEVAEQFAEKLNNPRDKNPVFVVHTGRNYK